MSLAFRRTCLLAALALLAAFAPLAQPALAATFTVTSVADTTATGTLRWAITQANASAGADTITFNIATAQPWTIAVASSLPALTDQAGVTIDGSVGGVPKIEIRGGGGVTDGLQVLSSNNIVRGLIVNGFTGAGIAISASVRSATNNLVEQCYIGTNAAGNAAGAAGTNNGGAGVYIRFGASNNTINNNVISANSGYGVFVYTLYSSSTSVQQSNTISNNRIGVTADGSAKLSNTKDGVYIGDNSNNNVVGPGNVISGNGPTGSTTVYGVNVGGRLLSASAFISGNRVIGNRIGTNAAGTVALPNAFGGVYVGQSNGTAIGGPNGNAGTAGGDGNLISGNTGRGIEIQDDFLTSTGVTGAVVQNNWIGVNATGNAALENTEAGVLVWKQASGVTIGPNNVISGNRFYGVWLIGARNQVNPTLQTKNNLVTGNIIGAGANGTTALPNGFYGINMEGGTTGNTITGNSVRSNTSGGVKLATDTGTTPLSPNGNTFTNNQISNNNTTGLQLLNASSNNIIGPGNTIANHTVSGLTIATSQNTVKGNTISGNQIGITISNAATGNTIGGTNIGDGNNLINNTVNGVLVSGAGTINNKITHTTTNNNGNKGIKLDAGGNAPIVGASLSGLALSGTNLSGSIANPAACGGTCTIEVFTDNSPLVDEGPAFVTSFTSTGSFAGIPLPNCQQYLIFTVTNSAGNTSEFTNPIGPFAQCAPAAPIVTLSNATPAASQGALPGASATFQHTVSNTGTAAGALTITTASSNGWTVVLNKSACPLTLAAGGSCNITLTVTVPAGTAPGQFNDTTITAALAGAAVSAQRTDRTTALSAPALTFVPEPPGSNSKTVGSGQPVTYQHKLTNTGNGPDSFDITVTPPAGWTFTVQPSNPIALAQGASTIVTVVLTPPPATPAGSYAATVRATSRSSASVFQNVTDTTTITAASVPQISSVVTPSNANQGATVTIAYTVANVGNQNGTFNLSFTPPPGWIVTQPAPASVTVPFSGPPATFNVILQVPGSAIAGGYPATLTATATSAPNAAATKTDQITVNQKGALTLGPNFDDPVLRAPNTVVTYTNQLLTNSGNFTDTIHLAASTNHAGWSAQPVPATVTLNPGASMLIPVVLTIPLGQLAGVQNTTTVTATSSLPAVFDTSLITTTIDAVSAALFTPTSQSKVIDAGKPITFTFTLVNSGSVPQSYTLTQAGAPGGWISTLTPASPTATLAPGATLAVTLVLQAPAGTPDNTPANVTITAACGACANAATATAHLTIGPPFSVGVGGNCNGPALPGAVLTCVHTVTNTGFSSDTYLITTLSPLGWTTAVAPALMFLAPGATGTVTITLAVPTSADAGLQHVLTVTARSTALPSVSQSLTDTTTVLQVGGISFSPSRITPTIGGQLVQFQHTVLNTGNGMDTYTITATQALNWSITIVPTTTNALPRGTYQTIQVSIQVPPGTTTVVSNRITLRATSKFAPAIFEELEDIVGSPQNVGIRWHFTYLPVLWR